MKWSVQPKTCYIYKPNDVCEDISFFQGTEKK